LDADTTTPDLDIGPAVAKLRFFRFAEYVLVFLAIVAVPIAVDLYMLGDERKTCNSNSAQGSRRGR